MQKDSYFVIGVMSGTSLDGLDLCYAQFIKEKGWTFSIIQTTTVPYSEYWIEQLTHVIDKDDETLKVLDLEYTRYLADQINAFIETFDIFHIDAVCSHGHTVFHQPEQGLTYQIGNQKELASLIGHTVVCDFRVQDVAFGGQGAPLVPIGDALLFPEYDLCLNLGGFSNISLNQDGERLAFDICPVNTVLNYYAAYEDLPYDAEGDLAAIGRLNPLLLKDLNELEFYHKEAPKSLGLEWVKSEVIPLIDSYEIIVEDVLRTFVEHIAIQISKVVNARPYSTLLVTGGGVFNNFLMERITGLCPIKIVIPSKEIIENKEALIFGFLGVLRLRNEVNCLRSVTGAIKDHSSGKIFQP